MQLLRRDCTLIAPDFIGHGESDKRPGDYSMGNQAAALRDFLEMVGVHSATIVGQSFGGGVAMQFV